MRYVSVLFMRFWPSNEQIPLETKLLQRKCVFFSLDSQIRSAETYLARSTWQFKAPPFRCGTQVQDCRLIFCKYRSSTLICNNDCLCPWSVELASVPVSDEYLRTGQHCAYKQNMNLLDCIPSLINSIHNGSAHIPLRVRSPSDSSVFFLL